MQRADPYDVAIVGGGIAGMSVAARLQALGHSTIVLEAHALPGGCAGYFRRSGFAFDVGATTLVDFCRGGVGGELLAAIDLSDLPANELPGYVAWLPDRAAVLHRDSREWRRERLRVFGDSPGHRGFWALVDHLSDVFWQASRRGVKLPVQGVSDLIAAVGGLGAANLPLLRYLRWTAGDALRQFGLEHDAALRGLLSMLIEDTVHGSLERAPLVNSVMGITIRGAGLSRARGGMFGFWRAFGARYRALGGVLRLGTRVRRIRGHDTEFVLETRKGPVLARQVVSALPADLSAEIGPPELARRLGPYLRRDARAQGGAVVLFLGVPEAEVSAQSFTHHQLLERYGAPLGDGNNLFISVSAAGDELSAPPGYRAVMISTHTELSSWEGLGEEEYQAQKAQAAARLLELSRRVYPNLGARARVRELATPRTYARFTGRTRGAVGGSRLDLTNSNQHAIPHDLGVAGLWLCGDTTWPGLGTVACVLGSRIVARAIDARSPRRVVPALSRGAPVLL